MSVGYTVTQKVIIHAQDVSRIGCLKQWEVTFETVAEYAANVKLLRTLVVSIRQAMIAYPGRCAQQAWFKLSYVLSEQSPFALLF